MAQGGTPLATHSIAQERFACSLNREDLRRLSEKLQMHADAAHDLELQALGDTIEQFDDPDKARSDLEGGFTLRFGVNGRDGSRLYGLLDEVFDSPNFPDEVVSYQVFSETMLNVSFNYVPRNKFALVLSFEKPEVFDLAILPSVRTVNASSFEVEGQDATWVNGLYSEVERFLRDRPSMMTIVHQQARYDLFLYALGIPFSFWVCHRVSPLIEAGSFGFPIVANALLVYAFMTALLAVRLLWHYLRWAYPLMEFKFDASRIRAHRAALWAIGTGLVVAAIVEVIRALG